MNTEMRKVIHKINNKLFIIAGYATLLKEELPPIDKNSHRLEEIEKAVKEAGETFEGGDVMRDLDYNRNLDYPQENPSYKQLEKAQEIADEENNKGDDDEGEYK